MDYGNVTFAFERRTVDLSSGPLTCFVAGNGPPVLYFHGRGGLRKSIPHNRLAERFRLYLPVHPGFDGTGFHDGVGSMPALAALYEEFAGHISEGPCAIVGHSFGGWLALWFAVNHPERISRLALECPAGFRPGGEPSTQVDAEAVRRALYAHPERLPPDDRPDGMEDANRLKAPHYHGGMPLDEALVSRLGEIRCPSLLLYGDRDRIIPEATCRILQDGIAGLRLTRISDAAHGLEIDQPERISDALVGFLRS